MRPAMLGLAMLANSGLTAMFQCSVPPQTSKGELRFNFGL